MSNFKDRSVIKSARPRTNHISFSIMLGTMLDGPSTVTELMNATGMNRCTIQRYTKTLYRDGNIYVGAWEKDTTGRQNVPAFAVGRKEDARRPPPKTQKEYRAAHALRNRLQQVSIALHTPAREEELETT